MSDDQRLEYQQELEQLHGAGVPFEFSDEPDRALDQVGELDPCMVIVGMDLGEMEGLEFVALMMNRYKSYEGKVLVLPNRDDPFPPVVQQRNTKTGKSSTDQIESDQVARVVLETALGAEAAVGATTPTPAAEADAPPAPPVSPGAPTASPAVALPPTEEPEALPAPPARPDVAPPGMAPLPSAKREDVLAPVPVPTSQRSGLPVWLLPAGAVAVIAVAAIIYVATRGGGDEKPTPAPDTAHAKTTQAGGATGAATGDEPTGDEPTGDEPTGDEPTGDEPTGDEPTGDEPTGDEPTGEVAPKPGQGTHPELRDYATLPLEFSRGGSDFTIADEAALDEAVGRFTTVLEEDATVWVEIGGHTSIDGAPEANYDLGKRRANKVRRLLDERGIPKARTIIKNYGAAMPIASNDDSEGRQKNRRVTLRLVD